IVFASGLLCADIITAVAALTFLDRQFRPKEGEGIVMIVLVALSLLFAGAGPFTAALRSGRVYAASFGCPARSLLLLLAPPLAGTYFMEEIFGGLMRHLRENPMPLLVASLLLAATSLVLAVVLPAGARQMTRGRG